MAGGQGTQRDLFPAERARPVHVAALIALALAKMTGVIHCYDLFILLLQPNTKGWTCL